MMSPLILSLSTPVRRSDNSSPSELVIYRLTGKVRMGMMSPLILSHPVERGLLAAIHGGLTPTCYPGKVRMGVNRSPLKPRTWQASRITGQ